MNWSTDISKKLSLTYPVIQAPMFGVTTPQMVAAATRAGCLGSLPLGDLAVEDCRSLIRETKRLTDKPFAINIFVNEVPELSAALRKQYSKTKTFIEKLAREHDLEITLPEIDTLKMTRYQDQLDLVMEENCPIVSFTFGNLDGQSIHKLKKAGITLIGTCTSVHEALSLEHTGIDIICVQGYEAGGHRGTFGMHDIPHIGGLSLLSQVYDCVRVPLIYGGGIYNAKTLLASRMLGAQGFQLGSVLLGSAESALNDFEKERLKNISEKDIVLTKAFSGRYARGINNGFIEAVENTPYILPYPYQNKLTGALRKLAKTNKNSDFVSIWVGQSINAYSERSAMQILKEIIAETERVSSREDI